LTRLIGAEEYGRYAGPMAIVLVLVTISTLGTDVWLIRRPTDPTREDEDHAFTLLLVAGCVVTVLALALSYPLGALVDESFVGPFRALACTIPINVLFVPAFARLERSFRHRALALIDLAGDGVYYGVAIAIAAAWDVGAWGPVGGQVALQLWLLAASTVAARLVPTLRWDRATMSHIARSGRGVAGASWLVAMRDLVNPLIVGRYLGAAAVGQVAVALRLVDALAVVKRATSRLGAVALAKVQDDIDRLRRAHGEAMRLQVIGAGVPLALGTVLLTVLAPVVLGDEWSDVAAVASLVALATLIGTLFNLHSSVLQILGRNRPVVALRGAQLAVFLVAAPPLIGSLGVIGYGLAEIARMTAFGLIDRSLRRVFVPQLAPALRWLAVLAPTFAAPFVPLAVVPLLMLPALAYVLLPDGRREVREVASAALTR
jgi:O-antigen/teichoic acid export membrane protein